MSIESVAIALHHSQASGTAKLVLIGIANHDGDSGSFPKVATLAKYANVHPRRIVEAVRKLELLGEVVTHKQEGGTRSLRDEIRPNVYEFVLTCPANCDRTKGHHLLDEQGYALKFGRGYKGVYDPDREKDAAQVDRGRKGWEDRQGGAVDNAPADGLEDVPGPSAEISTSAENSTSPSAENSTTPSAENSTTMKHQEKHPQNPALVPSVTSSGGPVEKSAACEYLTPEHHAECSWRGCGCDCHGIRAVVPVLPRATTRNDAAKGIRDPLGLTPEQRSRNERGAALARAALRGGAGTNEAGDDK